MKFKVGDLVKVTGGAIIRARPEVLTKIGYVVDIRPALPGVRGTPFYYIQLFEFAEPACLYESEIELA
jgi:hypothetical protein